MNNRELATRLVEDKYGKNIHDSNPYLGKMLKINTFLKSLVGKDLGGLKISSIGDVTLGGSPLGQTGYFFYGELEKDGKKIRLELAGDYRRKGNPEPKTDRVGIYIANRYSHTNPNHPRRLQHLKKNTSLLARANDVKPEDFPDILKELVDAGLLS